MLLAAVGVVLTPIYLLSMLRAIFYGEAGEVKPPTDKSWQILPREAFVALCLLIPIIGIGLYPKIAIQTYSAKTTAVAAQVTTKLPDVPNAAPLSKVMNMPGAEQIIAPSL